MLWCVESIVEVLKKVNFNLSSVNVLQIEEFRLLVSVNLKLWKEMAILFTSTLKDVHRYV